MAVRKPCSRITQAPPSSAPAPQCPHPPAPVYTLSVQRPKLVLRCFSRSRHSPQRRPAFTLGPQVPPPPATFPSVRLSPPAQCCVEGRHPAQERARRGGRESAWLGREASLAPAQGWVSGLQQSGVTNLGLSTHVRGSRQAAGAALRGCDGLCRHVFYCFWPMPIPEGRPGS